MSKSVRMYSSARPEIEWGGLSHIGPVREDNQDAILLPDCLPEGFDREGSSLSDPATGVQSPTVPQPPTQFRLRSIPTCQVTYLALQMEWGGIHMAGWPVNWLWNCF